MQWKLPLDENRSRVARVREAMSEAGVDACYLTSATDIFYLSAFSAVSTERPAALVLPCKGPLLFLGPRLEESHVRVSKNLIEKVRTYFDYPGREHPMEKFAGFLRDEGLGEATLWTDNHAGYGGLFGYHGPSLANLMPKARFLNIGDLLVDMQTIKSAAEIALLKESARWGDRAMECLLEAAAPGLWDVEVEVKASLEASKELRAHYGRAFELLRLGSSMPAEAGFRGQVGPDSSVPHAFSTQRLIEPGDVLGTGASAQIGGYESELERALVVGEPTDEQRRFFDAMVEAQDGAFARIGPGVPCAEVDDGAFAVLKRLDVDQYTLHHRYCCF